MRTLLLLLPLLLLTPAASAQAVDAEPFEGSATSFLNKLEGWKLESNGPSAGIMEKTIFHTTDGGQTWTTVGAPPAGGFYATGISFRSPMDGWITGTYHGEPDVPFFRTKDAGKSWQLQPLHLSDDFEGAYADTYPPVFTGPDRKHGTMPMHIARHTPPPDHVQWIDYVTDDGGEMWTPSDHDRRETWRAPGDTFELRYAEGSSIGQRTPNSEPGQFTLLSHERTVWSWKRWRDNSASDVDVVWADDAKTALILDRSGRGDTDLFLLRTDPAKSITLPLEPFRKKALEATNDPDSRQVEKSWFAEWKYLDGRFVGLWVFVKDKYSRLLLGVDPGSTPPELRLLAAQNFDEWRNDLGKLQMTDRLSAHAGAATPDDYFPLEKGTTWTYDVDVEYSVREADPPAPLVIRKKHLQYEVRVLEHVKGDGYEAALLDGYPSDLCWYEEGQARSRSIVMRTGTNNYFRLTGDKVDELWKELQTGSFGYHEELNGAALILQAPLEAGMRFGDLSQTARSRYCWVVEGTVPVKGIAGIASGGGTAYSLAFRTSPDHTLVDFLPGVGITRFEYRHHGTVANAVLKLTKFQPGTGSTDKLPAP